MDERVDFGLYSRSVSIIDGLWGSKPIHKGHCAP